MNMNPGQFPTYKTLFPVLRTPATPKHHDSPKTPYQRIMVSSHIQESVKRALTKQLDKLNPFLLRNAMDKKLKKIFSINNNQGF